MSIVLWFEKWKQKRASRSLRKGQANCVYRRVVKQARHPWFYSKLNIDDTVEKRSELVILHLFVVSQCFRDDSDFILVVRSIMEVWVEDLDRALRALGTGDLVIGLKVKKMVAKTMVRLTEYREAYNLGDEEFYRAVECVFFQGKITSEEVTCALLVNYIQNVILVMAGYSFEQFMEGEVSFPNLELKVA